MCTLALFFQVFEQYPLIVAANRDERYNRPTASPALLECLPRRIAGRDLQAGGTWLGVNERGLIAAILNRKSLDTPSPGAGRRSRGLLCADLLDCAGVGEARELLLADKYSYEPFTLVVADAAQAWVAANSASRMLVEVLSPGLHVFGNTLLHDEWSEKKERAYTLFADVAAGLDVKASPSSWIAAFVPILSDHAPAGALADSKEAICVHGAESGTVSSSIIVYAGRDRRLHTFYSPGPPCRTSFQPAISLDVR